MDHAGRRPAANGGWVVDPGSGRGSGFHRRTGISLVAQQLRSRRAVRPSLSQRPGEKHATVASRARPGSLIPAGLRPSRITGGNALVLRASVRIAILIFVKIQIEK